MSRCKTIEKMFIVFIKLFINLSIFFSNVPRKIAASALQRGHAEACGQGDIEQELNKGL